MSHEGFTLICPVRGPLDNTGRSADGLTQNEEYQRVTAIKYLISVGYPKDNFRVEVVQKRFGNNGRNSFRCDFAVLDQPAANISHDPDDVLRHAMLLCEVKRDSSKKEWVEKTQVEPMLDFARRRDAVALYWSGDVRRVFWHEDVNGIQETREAPLSSLPSFGQAPHTEPLTFATIRPCPSLLDVFSKIEDVLHNAGLSKERRYEAIFQLLLAKIFDEHAFETRPGQRLEMQDFASLGYSEENAAKVLGTVVAKAVKFYQKHLPNTISKKLVIPRSAVLDIMRILAPFKIIASNRDVIQTFYMKFAKDMYKWDMAQYFTPTRVSDFVVEICNPQFGELVCDPACGSADFLVGAFRYGKRYNPGYADSVYGYDNDANAIQVAVLNMVLNGDGKSNIHKIDSLESIDSIGGQYDLVICNPPFGSRIVETRQKVLSNFDLGHELSLDESGALVQNGVLDKQETGILFIEACLKLLREDGGRVAIILPNGYLGNTSTKFRMVREWLLRHASIAAIVSLPRFTFKSSGADVSASIVFLDKRPEPLTTLEMTRGQHIAFEMINKLGWNAGDKRQATTYIRNQDNGTLLIGDDGLPLIDSDYSSVLDDLLDSQAALEHPWLLQDRSTMHKTGQGWSVDMSLVLDDPDHSLDPKYFCRKNQEHRAQIKARPNMALGEMVDVIAELSDSDGTRVVINPSGDYAYADLSHITHGAFEAVRMKGWQLPDRARHLASAADIYFGSIWGSVGKWCLAPKNCDGLVITNGCFRTRMKRGKERYLTDLVAYITTESWASQMRAMARGSDGLAEIPASARTRAHSVARR
ncbi:MAG: N-6 DNA methylase [Coriobacteriaceae bacterium]|nr:N-6 DNA methylase [Coriobacteriaceae bacterium]